MTSAEKKTGLNAWYDLMTTDVEGAMAFYSEVIGWKTQPYEPGDPDKPYTMWVAGEQPMGGVSALPEEAKQMGAPPHWLAYTTVENVDETVAKAKELGAKVYAEPFDIPMVGRISVLADPQGATFAVMTPLQTMATTEGETDVPGRFSWADLNTTDWESAFGFYATLFGWTERGRMEDSPAGVYVMFQEQHGHTKGGMCNMAAQANLPPHWMHYATVDDVNAAAERVKKMGGKVINGPMPVPGGDLIVHCQDPQGGVFAMYSKAQ